MSEISLGMENNELIPLGSKEKMLSRKEAAEFLGLRENTLAIWAIKKRYDLPMYKVGKNVKYKITDLQKFKEGIPLSDTIDSNSKDKKRKIRNLTNSIATDSKSKNSNTNAKQKEKKQPSHFRRLVSLLNKALSFGNLEKSTKSNG